VSGDGTVIVTIDLSSTWRVWRTADCLLQGAASANRRPDRPRPFPDFHSNAELWSAAVGVGPLAFDHERETVVLPCGDS
jgi:hypothetical protein